MLKFNFQKFINLNISSLSFSPFYPFPFNLPLLVMASLHFSYGLSNLPFHTSCHSSYVILWVSLLLLYVGVKLKISSFAQSIPISLVSILQNPVVWACSFVPPISDLIGAMPSSSILSFLSLYY